MSQYIELPVKDSEDVYYVPYLTVRDTRQVVNKCLALLAPIIGDGYDSYAENEQLKIQAYASANLENLDSLPEESDMKMFSMFATIGSQLDSPIMEEIQDLLLKGAKFSSKGKVAPHLIDSLPDYDIDQVRGAKAYSQYVKVLKTAFELNAYVPFVECLNAVGFSEILGKLQAIVPKKLLK